jgi:hypothetical protein
MPDATADVPVLIAQTGELQGNRWAIKADRYTIGRAQDCNMVVPARQVSRYHAQIERTAEGYRLEDLASKNGTHINGAPVPEGGALLQDGDVIQIALAVKLIFVGTEATVPLGAADASKLGLGHLRMDPQAHRVWIGERELDPPLSPAQYRLLDMLYENSERVVARDEIVGCVWPESDGEGVSEQAIDALVRRLRDRLAELDREHAFVVTVRGHGFRLDNPI